MPRSSVDFITPVPKQVSTTIFLFWNFRVCFVYFIWARWISCWYVNWTLVSHTIVLDYKIFLFLSLDDWFGESVFIYFTPSHEQMMRVAGHTWIISKSHRQYCEQGFRSPNTQITTRILIIFCLLLSTSQMVIQSKKKISHNTFEFNMVWLFGLTEFMGLLWRWRCKPKMEYGSVANIFMTSPIWPSYIMHNVHFSWDPLGTIRYDSQPTQSFPLEFINNYT